ncbi:MAG: DUF977 family protein [Bacteroidales bacterium]|nr:DUF977 family protein [Bacteroidales bacterium]
MHDKLHDKILELIKENERVTIPELSNMLGVSVRTINSYLKKMQEMNLIIRVGARKNGYWKVNI